MSIHLTSQRRNLIPIEDPRLLRIDIPSLAYRLSGALALLLVVASAAGFLVDGLYRAPDNSPYGTPAWHGVDFIDLIVTVPALILSMIFARRGSRRAYLVWSGVLAYVAYNYTLVCFDVAFNRLFLIYVAILALAAWSLLLLLTHLDTASLRNGISPQVPVRAAGTYLLLVAGLFAMTWLKDIIPAILSNGTPQSVIDAQTATNPVHVLDLALLLPLLGMSGIWLLRRRPWGIALAAISLVQLTLLAANIMAGVSFQYAAGISVSLAPIPMFALLAGIALVLAVRLVGGLFEDMEISS